ncbi:MAG TPA: hypothetical protein VKN64_05270 [Halanaerobiales bacterium]|nr:hypothetical protein [Halanaerobiales bacterium]
MKKLLSLLIVTLFVFSITFVGSTMYLPESIDDDMIENSIEVAKESETPEDLIVDNGYRFDLGGSISGKGMGSVDVLTPRFDLLELAFKKAKKYKEPKEEEIKTILNDETFKLMSFLASEDKPYEDDLHIVIKKQNEEIVQPVDFNLQFVDYDMDSDLYFSYQVAVFNLDELNSNNGQINETIEVILISNLGEIKGKVDLSSVK